MTRPNSREMGTDADMLSFAKEVEDEYGYRLRISINPLPRPSGKSTHAIVIAAYTASGKRVADMDTEQCYFPGGTSKTLAGACLYLLQRMAGIIDEYAARKKREEEQWEEGVLTPLEQYIANSF